MADNPLVPERVSGEPFEAYKERRRGANDAVRMYLQGTYVHVSNKFVPHAVTGKPVRIGITYVKPKDALTSKGRGKRRRQGLVS
jgi:hypothetical protein